MHCHADVRSFMSFYYVPHLIVIIQDNDPTKTPLETGATAFSKSDDLIARTTRTTRTLFSLDTGCFLSSSLTPPPLFHPPSPSPVPRWPPSSGCPCTSLLVPPVWCLRIIWVCGGGHQSTERTAHVALTQLLSNGLYTHTALPQLLAQVKRHRRKRWWMLAMALKVV